MDEINRIMTLASIRKFVDENMPEGMYFDVFDIKSPSDDGDYSGYDAIIPLSSMEEKRKIENLFSDIKSVKVAVICL
jgi:hypothetical protein